MGIKAIYSLTLLMMLYGQCKAQRYDKAAGFRLGHISGITYQNHYSENQAMEIMLTFHKDGVQGMILNEWFEKLPGNTPEDFYFYYGVGGHLGYKKYSREKLSYDIEGDIIYDYSKKGYYSIGVDGIAGLEYRIYEVPMTVGLEIQPVLDFYGLRYVDFEFFNFQVSFKYIF